MTVQELINELSKLPGDKDVLTEGCCCVQPIDGATLDDDGDVIITIPGGLYRPEDYREKRSGDDD